MKECAHAPAQSASEDWIEIGQFGAPHGIRGWLRFQPFLEDPHLCFRLQPWYLQGTKTVIPAAQAWKAQGKRFLVQLESISDREAAAWFTNRYVVVARKGLPPLPKGEYYWHELIGARVVNHRNIYLGKVINLLDLGPHSVLVVQDSDTEDSTLIPLIQGEIVLNLSHSNIIVRWEKGD